MRSTPPYPPLVGTRHPHLPLRREKCAIVHVIELLIVRVLFMNCSASVRLGPDTGSAVSRGSRSRPLSFAARFDDESAIINGRTVWAVGPVSMGSRD